MNASGIVESRGGREGGYWLRKSAGEITLGEIYDAVGAGPCSEAAEADGGACSEAGAQLDAALERILQAEQRAIQFLRGYTIADYYGPGRVRMSD